MGSGDGEHYSLPPVNAWSFPMSLYTNDQINVLRDATNLACKELRIGPSDQERCEQVALFIMRQPSGARNDVMQLKTYAVEHFKIRGGCNESNQQARRGTCRSNRNPP
jgi:hypothetical protein